MTEHNPYLRMSRDELLREIQLVQRMLGSTDSLPALVHELQVHREEVSAQQSQLEESQRALEDSRDRYADLYDYAPIGIVTLDDGGTIREANLAIAALLAVKRERLIGLPLLGRVVEADRRIFLEHLSHCRASADGTTLSLSLRLVTGPSTNVMAGLVCRATRGANGDLLLQTGIFDLSAIERAESARRASELDRLRLLREDEALRAEAAAKDRFFAILSHELRTPLTPILFTLGKLEARVAAMPAEVRDALVMIRRNVELEARLIDDLLDTTRISHGKLHLQIETLDVHEMVQSLVETASGEIQSARIALELDLHAPRHHVSGDALRLRQVLWNVLSNSIRHTPPEGRITFASSNPDPGSLRLVISDTGAGIAPDVLKRIFEPFEQAQSRTRAGLGLGLAISKGIVEAHHGRIVAHSEGHGRGTGIEIELTAIDAPAAQPRPVQQTHRASELRVLLVEDHQDSAMALREILEMQGHAVTLAGSLAEVCRHDGATFDLVISDIGLPDGSGLDVLQLLRARHPVRSIALSGYGSMHDVARSRDAGFDLHLTKPVGVDVLLSAIDSLDAPAKPARA